MNTRKATKATDRRSSSSSAKIAVKEQYIIDSFAGKSSWAELSTKQPE